MKKLFTVALLSGLFTIIHNADAQVNYNLVCVDSVWYEPGDSIFINVRIYNGDTLHMNYPSVQIVSPANDTIGNPSNFVNYFAQLGNTYQTYTDTITQPGIPNFSSYTFLINELFGDTTAVISWCVPVAVEEHEKSYLEIFPNPVTDKLYVIRDMLDGNEVLEIYDALGNLIVRQKLKAISQQPLAVNVSDLTSGIYFAIITDGRSIITARFTKQ